ncbi:MAG: DUF2085 domain-containing protein [Methanobacterium sp.]|nr:DUF2085 domain-containing protein [Methanobacterium sp.]
MNILKRFKICHQIPERSFHYKNKQFPVCVRCTGILLGYCSLPLFYFGLIKIPILLLILLIIPLLVDSMSQYMGFRESNNNLRLITGVLAGVGFSGLLVIFLKIIIGFI